MRRQNLEETESSWPEMPVPEEAAERVCVGRDGLALASAGSHSWDHFVLLQ